ncbi:MAG: hypothetical protein RLZZ289_1414, partial [Bacteroidota bacterium]
PVDHSVDNLNSIICNCRATIEDQGQLKVGFNNVYWNPHPIHFDRSYFYHFGIELNYESER